MSVYDIVCGKCGCHTFIGNSDGKSECKDCGYILIDKDIERLLRKANQEAIEEYSK